MNGSPRKRESVNSTFADTDSAFREHTLLQVFLFCGALIVLGWIVVSVMALTVHTGIYDFVANTGLYGLLFIPLACAFDPRILSKAYWNFPKVGWVGVGAIILSQIAIEYFNPHPPVGHFRMVGGLLIGPLVEESVRAVMIRPLTHRLGVPFAVILTAVYWASLHTFFWTALIQQVILSLIFVYTRRSLSCAIVAHLGANLIAVWNPLFQFILATGWHGRL
jgi:hypothetical protein